MAKQGRPKNTETSEEKKQVLVSISAIKTAKLTSIKMDINLSEFVAMAIEEKAKRIG